MNESFPWRETRARLEALLADHDLQPDGRGGFKADGLRFVPPAVLAAIAPGESPQAWLARLPDDLGRQAVLLVRAGSAAIGVWDGDECTRHKVFKRYVVRGHGKAQTTHLKTAGKSRYGSRLRLQNAKRLLEEVNERLRMWSTQDPITETIHWSCPVRQASDLFAADPPPPFARSDPRLRRITIHVHEPDFEELLRVRRSLERGRIERPD